MKIKTILIENFKGIEKLRYDFKSTTVGLVAENGKGKTAFREAFFAAITGEFPENCIQTGKDYCSVKITLDDDTTIERVQFKEKANKVLIDGKTTTAKTVNELITTKTGLSKDVWKVVASTDFMQQMKPSEFGAFIATYIPKRPNIDLVLSYMPSIPVAAEDMLRKHLPAMPVDFPLSTLTKMHTNLVDGRKIAKRELAALDAQINAFNGTTPDRDVKTIEQDMEELMRKDGAQKGFKTAMDMYNRTNENRKKTIENLQKIYNRIMAMNVAKPVVDDLNKIKQRQQAVQQNINNAKVSISTAETNIKMFERTLANLNKPVCPISEKLICTTDKTSLKDEMSKMVSQNQMVIVQQKEIIENNARLLKELEAEEQAYRAQEAAYREKVILVNQYEEGRKNLSPQPPKPEQIEIVDYSQQISLLRKERDNARAYMEHLSNIKKRDAKKETVETYDYLCNAFNAKGEVMQKINSNFLGVFESSCNETAMHIRDGFEFKFFAENGITYMIKPSKDKEFATFESLSSGEQTMALFVLTDMFNKLTNSRIMILDDLDKLDKNAMAQLLDLAQSARVQSTYDHIILCAVNHEDIEDGMKKHNIDMVY